MNCVQRGTTFALVVITAGIAVAKGASPTVTDHSRLTRLPLGSVIAQGWLKTQLERSKAGMGGHLDELEPDMIAKPYVDRSHKSKVSPGWSGEISGTYWTGLVQLAFTLNDDELKAKADKWVMRRWRCRSRMGISVATARRTTGWRITVRGPRTGVTAHCCLGTTRPAKRRCWSRSTAASCGLSKIGLAIRRPIMQGRRSWSR